MRDRDYLMDTQGVIFKIIGDQHPGSHYLGYVKYYPDPKGDRRLFGQTYRQNSVVSKSFGVLAARPDCYVYSDVIGCVITGIPRDQVALHFSCREAVRILHAEPGAVAEIPVGKDLLGIIARIVSMGAEGVVGITGSFLVGCFNERSDIDLVCYGAQGYEAASELFHDGELIRAYAGDDLTRLFIRRAKYMEGSSYEAVLRQEQRKLQGLTTDSGAHVNCEPLRPDRDETFARLSSKEIGEMSVIAKVTDHELGLATPAVYGIKVRTVLSSTIDEPESIMRMITHMRSYLGAYTGAFRAGDVVHLTGKLVHAADGHRSSFGIELTPWSVSSSYVANLAC